MDYKKNEKFCLMPFITLNTRPNGQVKPCSQVMGMPGLKKDTTAEDILNSKNDFLNLTKDSVEEIWNSKFMQDFRMKKINGEYIEFCETCYQEDAMGADSKRSAVISKFYDDNKHLIEEAHKNNGYMETKPVWWEMRLSSICNQACRMCIPQTSSKMRQEFEKFAEELPTSIRQNTETAVKQFNLNGYLGDSDFFLDQFYEALPDMKYLELHGGEPTNDKKLWQVVEKIVELGHNKHIHIHVHTNIHALKPRHIELWDNFKSGWIGVSIDAYGKENEYIRHGSNWEKINQNLKLLKGLGPHWHKWITSSVMAYNCCTMHKLLDWFNEYQAKHGMQDLWWRMDPVTNPNLMRLEHIPMEMRLEAIQPLIELILETPCKPTRESIGVLIKSLTSTQKPSEGSFQELIDYTRILDIKRNQSLKEVFPHLKEVFDG